MAIIPTDEWLNKHFNEPIEMCKYLLKEFQETDASRIYQYLRGFGMYKPNSASYRTFNQLKEANCWETMESLERKYRKKWQGPDVKIYLFPIESSQGGFFREKLGNKAGVSFKDRVYLFINGLIDEKELEALFIHEYHHVCRLNRQKKEVDEYTLLDSMVLEGLAEWEVKRCLGEKYLADWCGRYPKDTLETYFQKYMKEHLQIKKFQPLHDQLLFGHESYPSLLGYAIGFYLVSSYCNQTNLSAKRSFVINSETFLTNNVLKL